MIPARRGLSGATKYILEQMARLQLAALAVSVVARSKAGPSPISDDDKEHLRKKRGWTIRTRLWREWGHGPEHASVASANPFLEIGKSRPTGPERGKGRGLGESGERGETSCQWFTRCCF